MVEQLKGFRRVRQRLSNVSNRSYRASHVFSMDYSKSESANISPLRTLAITSAAPAKDPV